MMNPLAVSVCCKVVEVNHVLDAASSEEVPELIVVTGESTSRFRRTGRVRTKRRAWERVAGPVSGAAWSVARLAEWPGPLRDPPMSCRLAHLPVSRWRYVLRARVRSIWHIPKFSKSQKINPPPLLRLSSFLQLLFNHIYRLIPFDQDRYDVFTTCRGFFAWAWYLDYRILARFLRQFIRVGLAPPWTTLPQSSLTTIGTNQLQCLCKHSRPSVVAVQLDFLSSLLSLPILSRSSLLHPWLPASGNRFLRLVFSSTPSFFFQPRG